MSTALAQSAISRWLLEHGPSDLELLFRAIVYQPSSPVLITDDEGKYQKLVLALQNC